MNIESLRDYCLVKNQVTESFPFDETTLVFKVAGKMFALLSLDAVPPSVNLKCDPEEAIALREEWDAVSPGYHMNKKHWNTVILDGSVPKKELITWVDMSYDLVVRSLPQKIQQSLY